MNWTKLNGAGLDFVERAKENSGSVSNNKGQMRLGMYMYLLYCSFDEKCGRGDLGELVTFVTGREEYDGISVDMAA